MRIGNGAEIILVDDDPLDAKVAKHSHQKSKIENPLTLLPSGTSLITYLEEVQRGERQMPALVLLDLNMPKMTGIEALEKIRTMPFFSQHPPIVILTTSARYEDKVKTEELGAIGFITKPFDLDSFVGLFDSLAGFV